MTYVETIINLTIIDSVRLYRDTIISKGEYQLKQNILYKNNVLVTCTGNTISEIYYYSLEQELAIHNNKMNVKTVYVFDSIGNNGNQLYGKWTRSGCYSNYSKTDPANIYSGKYEQSYTFYADSQKCNYVFKYITGKMSPTEHTFTKTYSLLQSYISFPGNGLQNLYVQFKNGKMFWYQNNQDRELIRE